MRLFRLGVIALLFTVFALAQSGRGTITGTLTDPSGAVVPNAALTARNVDTGEVYQAATTETGNYTLAQLPVGVYEVTIAAAGFAKYTRQGITVEVAQTERIDVVLQLASAGESVTVTADAPLLKTDSTDMSGNLSTNRVEALPLYAARNSEAALRNPYGLVSVMPGATMIIGSGENNSIHVNGLPNDTYNVQIEGQEATFTMFRAYTPATQPAMDALQEVSMQTSNFAAEYGQVGGGVVNFTFKSGTNQLHGSGFINIKNEAWAAGEPFSNNGHGGLVRAPNRSKDGGFSLGGPVYIPHVYNGKDKTFFFFNMEKSHMPQFSNGQYDTVPTTQFRNGDFSQILTGRVLNTDPLGRPIMENTIYDPSTTRTVNGQVVTDPFPGNIIPQADFDPVAVKIQPMFPLPTRAGLNNNYSPAAQASTGPAAWNQWDDIYTVKGDHSFGVKSKLSVYWSRHGKFGTPYIDGIPFPIQSGRISTLANHTIRANFDQTITPTLLAHIGVGVMPTKQLDSSDDKVLDYDAVGQLGLVGGIPTNFGGRFPVTGTGFPLINGLFTSYGGFWSMENGGITTIGPTNSDWYYIMKPTAVASLMWVHGNHSYKFGGEWRKNAFTDRNVRGSQGIYTITNVESGLPSTNGQNLSGGAVGFPYASFLLGVVNNASVQTPTEAQTRRLSWGGYAQDTWKATRKLTLTYGLRYDFQTALVELHDRVSAFAPTVVNPSAGGLLGGMAYAGTGPGRIGGEFTKNYPWAFGPRLGAAYQLNAKTVLRAGWGLTYSEPAGGTSTVNINTVGVGNWNKLLFTTQTYGQPAVKFSTGLPYTQQQLYGIGDQLDPGIMPSPYYGYYGQILSPPMWIDPQGARPGRVEQWSLTLQRQISKDLAVEASYVGNRGAWFPANGLDSINALTPQAIAAHGLNIANAADRSLLTSPMNSALAISRGFSTPLYAGYPLNTTVAQSLRPFPQFSSISANGVPKGDTWYDGLQMKIQERVWHGFEVSSAFSYQKELIIGTAGAINDVFNRQVQRNIGPADLPFTFSITPTYTIPKLGPNRWVRALTGGWSFGVVLRYQSGLPIAVPTANNALSSLLFQSTFASRVPGVPLYLKNLNCHCFDPNKTFVLNPAAWSDPPAGTFGTSSAFYNDYRYMRRDKENATLGRYFQIREGIRLQIRAVMFNMFNRTLLNDPTVSNALATQVFNSAGQTVSGFGYISTGTTYDLPRNGLLEGRVEF